jgi:RNA ligase (TIGR02306 family)
MRKLASIRKISEIRPIEGADAIELAIVDGWQTVVKKNEYRVGDLAVYLEVDSWVPTELAPFLSKGKEPRVFNGVKGERLRTVKLRGALSQGLLISRDIALPMTNNFVEGDDVTEILGIQKWERPVPAALVGEMKGSFPSFIPKTDQERAQNLVAEIVAATEIGMKFEITEKLEGSSMTVYRYQGEFGVCSRNIDLKRDENNTFWSVALRDELEAHMMSIDPYWDFAIQGELIGPGIQGNIYGLTKHEFHVFDVYDIRSGKYLDPLSRRNLIDRMGLDHVPVLEQYADLHDTLGITDIPQLLKFADGKSRLADTKREGIVFKQVDGGMTFKVISNEYLLGEK